IQTPRPWGVTVLLAEHTGTHPPLEINWPFEERVVALATAVPASAAEAAGPAPIATPAIAIPALTTPPVEVPPPSFGSLWEFALAVNRGDAPALALASNGSDGGVPIDAAELRKLLGTVWFRSVFPRLSRSWRDRLFEVLIDGVSFQNQVLTVGRQFVPLSSASYSQLNDVIARTDLPDLVRSDVQVLIAVGRLWGEEAMQRCRFTGEMPATPSKFGLLMHG